jgi:ubiquinone/menaquinone biosynthesis C-methylase UbiE
LTQQHYGRNFSSKAAENYEKYFVPAIGAPVATDLMKAASLRPGERVLDVGCGTGVVTRLAARETGSRVVGLDLNPGMLAVAQSVTPPGLSIDWHEASTESIPFPDEAFDVVLCQMTLQFVPDKPSAVREMHRVLVSEGRLLLNTPGQMQELFSIMEGALARHLSPEAAGFLKAVFSLHDPGDIQDLLTAGEFRDVGVQTTTVPLRLPTPGDFLWQYLHSTPLADAVRQLDDDRLAALEQDVVEKARDLVEEEGVTVSQGILVATGRK